MVDGEFRDSRTLHGVRGLKRPTLHGLVLARCRTLHGVRGLKLLVHELICGVKKSHPSRGAWIETEVEFHNINNVTSHPSRGAWIETKSSVRTTSLNPVAPFTGCVD